MKKTDINDQLEEFKLILLEKGYRINDFKCEVGEYSNYLKYDALKYKEIGISQTHLLINKRNADIVAYMSLVTDSIKLSNTEKNKHEFASIPFGQFPAIKVGKLAVDVTYKEKYRGIGTLMIEIARGLAFGVNESGVACKFITLDADIEHNPSVIDFYEKNGFKKNEQYKSRSKSISMRLDIYHE